MRKARAFAAAGAVLLIAASASVRPLAVPALLKLPANLDSSVRLTGTATLVDMTAIQAGDLGNAIRANIPVAITNRVYVASATSDAAVVVNESTVEGPGNALLQTATHSWAVDRRTFLPATAPAGSQVEPHQGLVLGFPLPPRARDYERWDFVTQTVVTARYRDTEEFAGRQAHVYTSHASGQVRDPATVRAIPQGLPVTLTATSDTTYWVDSETSVVLDVRQKQVTQAVIKIGDFALPPVTVFDLDASYSAESAATLRETAGSAGRGLFILRTVVPLTLLGAGLALATLVLRATRRARRSGPGSTRSG